MKTINFSCVEKLQSLLNESCSQTIRKAWEICLVCKGKPCSVEPECYICNETGFVDKEPKFKVGDEVKLMWDEKSKAEWFDRTKGEGLDIKQIKPDFKCMCFNKILGTATITKRTMLLITKQGNDYLCFERKNKRENWIELSIGNKQELAELDGFKSFRDLIIYFEKEHNIDFTTEKEFYRYLYKWL